MTFRSTRASVPLMAADANAILPVPTLPIATPDPGAFFDDSQNLSRFDRFVIHSPRGRIIE
jgi:hypothetical protein